MTDDERRAELHRWIAETELRRRTLLIGLAIATLPAVASIFFVGAWGGFALGVIAMFALVTFWITTSHISDWRLRLKQLDGPKNVVLGGGRRW